MKTIGISPKTAAASLIVATGTLLTVVVLWAVTGEFDKAELTAALTGFIGAAAAFGAAYLADPGNVVAKEVPPPTDVSTGGPA